MNTVRNTMAPHWTYEKIEGDQAPLRQGDILWPKPALKSVFKDVHPHFCDAKYIAFIITTQSCDLVRRNGKPCKADYINLAVIRDLESCLSQFFDNVCDKVSSRVYSKQSKSEAYQLLRRILNQNEHALGLFYLHPDTDTIGISDYAIALLRVSVALGAKEHYEVLQKARMGRLAGQFRNKLGWLVGNLYSRVGTPDWNDQKGGDKQMEDLVHRLIDSEYFAWVSKAWVDAAEKAGVSVAALPKEELIPILEKHRPPPFKEQIADAASKEVDNVISSLPAQILSEINRHLSLKGDEKEDLKSALEQIVSLHCESIPRKVRNRLVNNSVVSKAISREELD